MPLAAVVALAALAAAQEMHMHTPVKIIKTEEAAEEAAARTKLEEAAARTKLGADGHGVHQLERTKLGADGHGVYHPRTKLGADGHGVYGGAAANLTRALLFAEASYCMGDVSPVSPAELAATVEITAVHERLESRAVIGWDNATGSAWVSFRGTENIENWWENIQFEKTAPYPAPYDAVEVETGFTKWYGNLLEGVQTAVKDTVAAHAPGATAPIRVYGHSAGGACAALMAFDVLRGGVFDNVQLAGLYTYGCPRVGDAAFVTAFSDLAKNVDVYRVTHRDDVVPHLPEEALGYLHMPHEMWQADATDPALTDCADSAAAEDDACSNSCAPFSCVSKADHLSYLGLVQGINGC